MRKKFISAIFGLASILLFVLPTSAGVTSNIIIPLAQDTFVDCANGGVGEVLAITGRIHILSTVTTDSAGGVHITVHFNPLSASGVGLDTGDMYRANGITRESFNVDGFPSVNTFVNHFHLIGIAGVVNFKVHNTIHVTIDHNGDLAANVDNTSVTCI
jgi:hypothetical protein